MTVKMDRKRYDCCSIQVIYQLFQNTGFTSFTNCSAMYQHARHMQYFPQEQRYSILPMVWTN